LDAVQALLDAPSADLQSLADAHIAFAKGRAASGEYRYGDADVALIEAQRGLEGKSPIAYWVAMLRAIVILQRNQPSQAEAQLRELRLRVGTLPYPALIGQIDWTLGVASATQGDFTGSFDNYRSALSVLQKIGESENISSVESLLAETSRMLGDVKGSWALQLSALSHLSQIRRPQRKQTVVEMAALAAARQDRPSAALDFQNRFLDAAKEIGSQATIGEALLYRARVYRQLGDLEHARQDLDASRGALDAAAAQRNVFALIPFYRAQVQLEDAQNGAGGDDARALQELSDALTYFKSSRIVWLPRVYLARARLLKQQGHRDEAEADLLAGIESLETQRKTVSSETLRVSYLDESWDLFGDMIASQLDRGRQREAFGFAERSRARSLVDAVGDSDAGALDPSQVAHAMPSGSLMLYFVSVRGHLAVWILGRGIERFVALNAEPDDVDRQARAYRRELEAHHDAAADALATALYQELIAPVRAVLTDGITVVVAPDRALHQVPFAALRDGVQGPFLIEHHPVVIAPSARLFFRTIPSTTGEGRASATLVIGNPSPDPSIDLPSLPGAEQEAMDIAALYPDATRLVRDEATRRRFIDAAPAASVIHIAAHAIANEEFPDLSRLFLAPEGESSGVLTASDLARLRFSRTKLVVLAACGTAAGVTFRGEGVTSLARPFLARGVPQVLGTLWEVDDETSRRLFTEFHRGYVRGLPAAKALQLAQLAVLRDRPQSSMNWAAIVLLGSTVSVAP
jgi:CHAT domain-containing protein